MIHVTEMEDDYLGKFYPGSMKIYINKNIKKLHPDYWRRITVGIIVHELVHMFEYVFLCGFNEQKFFDMPNPEDRANKIEQLILWLTGVVWVSE